MSDNTNIIKDTYSQWQKPILIGVGIFIVLILIAVTELKNTTKIKYLLNTYTDTFSAKVANKHISNVHSLLYYYSQGGNKATQYKTLEFRQHEQGIFIKVNSEDVGTMRLINSFKELISEQKGRVIFISYKNLESLNEKITYEKDRALLEKILNIDLINRNELKVIDSDTIDLNTLKNQIQQVQDDQNFISEFLLGDKSSLGKAEVKKIESKIKIDTTYKTEVKEKFNAEIKEKVKENENDKEGKVQENNFEEDLEKIKKEKELQKQKEEEERKQKELEKNNERRDKTLNDNKEFRGNEKTSEHLRILKKLEKQELVVPKNVQEEQDKELFDRYEITDKDLEF